MINWTQVIAREKIGRRIIHPGKPRLAEKMQRTRTSGTRDVIEQGPRLRVRRPCRDKWPGARKRDNGSKILTLSLAAVLLMTSVSRADAGTYYLQALTHLRNGNDELAFRDFEVLAEDGDARAQYALGRMLLDGRGGAPDRAQGYAWLQVAAARGLPGNYAQSFDIQFLEKALLDASQALSGAELLRAEQIASARIEARRKAVEKRRAQARPVVLGLDASRADERRLGCALDPRQRNCRKIKDIIAVPTPACTGQVVEPDVPPALMGRDDPDVLPEHPVRLRRQGVDGMVETLLHVDATGWVCALVVTKSSGDSSLDEAGLRAVQRWRFTPASAAGQPVEVLTPFQLDFALRDEPVSP